MRLYRRLPTIVARHVRVNEYRLASISTLITSKRSVRAECGAICRLMTSTASATQDNPSRIPVPSVSTQSSPAIAMLQTLSSWAEAANASHHHRHKASVPTDPQEMPVREPSRSQLNRSLKKALEIGDFHSAQQHLTRLMELLPAHSTHPVDTENYDRLLYQWSQQSVRHKQRQRGKQSHVDLAPMLTLLQDMIQWQRVNARSFNTALVACHKLHALDEGKQVLQLMKQANRQPKAFAYTNLISCCARLASKHNGRRSMFVEEAEKLFEELETNGSGVTIEAVNAMVFVYRAGDVGNSSQAVDLVETALREWKLKPDTSTISTLVVCLLKDRNALEAARWVEYALQHRVGLEDAIVRDVVEACRRGAHWDKIETLRELLQTCGVAHQDRELKQILQQGQFHDDSGVNNSEVMKSTKKNPASHNGASSLDSKKTVKKLAREALRSLMQDVAAGTKTKLSKAEWVKIFEHGPIDEIDQLMQVLPKAPSQHFQTGGVVKKPWLNQMYLRALGSAGHWWRVADTLDIILKKAPREVDIYGLNAAIRCCTRSGRLHEAVRVVERAEKLRIPLNRESYDALMQCCASVGSVEGALTYFHEVERAGIEPNSHDLNATLRAFATSVQRLMDTSRHDGESELDVPGSDLSKLAVQALRFFEEATSKHEDLEISETSVFHLFRSFLGAAEMIDEVDFSEFQAFSNDPNVEDEDFERTSRESQAEWLLLSGAVQQICRDAPDEVVSPRVINVAVDFFQRRGEPDSAFELFNTMVSRGIVPTPDTIRLLFAACYSNTSDPQLGQFFLEHLLTNMSEEVGEHPELRQVVANEALRWAGRMDNNAVGSSSLVESVYETLVSSGVVAMEASMYEEIMGVYAHDGNLQQAKQLAERMLADTGTMTLSVGNRVLQACSVARAPVFALQSLEWLKNLGVQPDVVSYNNVLSSIRRRRVATDQRIVPDDDEDDGSVSDQEEDHEDEESASVGGEEEDEETNKPDRGDRLARLEANLSAVVDNLLLDMEQSGVAADARTFESVVSIAFQRGEVERVVEMFDKILQTAIDRRIEASELLTEKTLLQYLDACTAVATAQSGSASSIAHRLDDLQLQLKTWRSERGYKVTPALLQRLLYGYDAVDQWRTAVAIMKNSSDLYGVRPGVEMLKAVMEICNRAEQYKAAEQIFVTMKKQATVAHDGRVHTSAACYVEAIYALEQQANWIQATQLFMEMQKSCPVEELHPSLLNRIALGRYAQGRQRPD